MQDDVAPPGLTKILLVHGVGLPSGDLFGSRLKRNIDAWGLQHPPEISEVDWHERVEKPYATWSLYNPRYTVQLMRGLIGLASGGHQVPFAVRVVDFILFAAPLALWFGLALVLRSLHTFVDPSTQPTGFLETASWFLKRASWALWKAIAWPLPPLSCAVGSEALQVYAWLVVTCVAALWLVVFLHKSMFDGLRVVGVTLLRPLLFSVSLIRQPAVIGLFVISATVAAISAVLLPDRQVQVLTHDALGVAPLAPPSVSGLYLLSFIAAYGVTGAGILIAVLIARALVFPLKVVADVACYLGDSEYSMALREHVSTCLDSLKLKAGDHLLLVGHSLGSVILVDWLRRSHSRLPGSVSVTLVTLGSPLRRFVARFCQGIFETPDRLAAEFSRDLCDFYWVNVYRPFDPIGTSLFRNQSSSTHDACTRQWKKLGMAAHTGYWDDEHALSIVRESLTHLPARSETGRTRTAPETTEGPDSFRLSASTAISFFERQSSWLSTAMAATFGIAIGFLSFNVASTDFLSRDRFVDHGAYRNRLESAGVATTGWLYHFSRIEGFGAPNGKTTIVPIDYHLVIFRRKEQYIGYFIDERHSHWPLARIDERLPAWEPAIVLSEELFLRQERRARRWTVTVRYLEDDPEQYDIAELEVLPTLPLMRKLDRMAGVFLAVVIGGLLAGYVWWLSKLHVAAYCGVLTPDPLESRDRA